MVFLTIGENYTVSCFLISAKIVFKAKSTYCFMYQLLSLEANIPTHVITRLFWNSSGTMLCIHLKTQF